MQRHEELMWAVATLQLPDKATLAEIRAAYRRLAKKWHPDTCEEKPEICEERMKEIVKAYKILCDYCANYRYSFREEDLQQPPESDLSAWWQDRFGNDPIWSNVKARTK